jgi:diguanylate cyclase (GGDEF)-like protein
MFGTAIFAGYALLTAWEIWRGRAEALPARVPAAAFLLIHALVLIARIPFGKDVPFPFGSPWFVFAMFETLFYAIGLSFMLVVMAKERGELRHRHAALFDPLTGVLNRGAFIAEGERLLSAGASARRPTVALAFDLDHFKQINDTHGHRGGDRTLVEFCRTAQENLAPGDIFGRLGGEEFACLLPGLSLHGAAAVAEKIRAEFAARRITAGGRPIAATVSVGAAITLGGEQDLDHLLAVADTALYRAKARGRNLVEWERPALASAR